MCRHAHGQEPAMIKKYTTHMSLLSLCAYMHAHVARLQHVLIQAFPADTEWLALQLTLSPKL